MSERVPRVSWMRRRRIVLTASSEKFQYGPPSMYLAVRAMAVSVDLIEAGIGLLVEMRAWNNCRSG